MLFRNLLFTLENDSGTWKTLENYSQYVHWGTLATDNNFVYSFGSHSTINSANGSSYKWAKDTNTWTQIANLSSGNDGNYACYYQGFFYIFTTTTNVLKYDPILNTFSTYASMPVTGEKWYGCLKDSQAWVTFGDNLYMFDINSKVWSAGLQIPRGSTSIASKYPGVAYVPSTGDVLLIGGTDSPERIVAYNTWYSSFGTFEEKLPTGEGRHAMASVVSGSKVYICGGMSAINSATKKSLVFDTSNLSITEIADMPSAYGRTGSVLFDGWIMVLGGYTGGTIGRQFFGYVI